MSIDAAHYIDTERYPIAEPGAARDELIAGLRSALDRDGCAVLHGFVHPERLPELVAECDRVAQFGHRNFTRTNPYFTADRPELPATHPLRRFYDRSNAFVPADHFGDDSILRAIYEWPAFAPFVQAALGETDFHRYADPLADVIVNLAEEGGGFPWHFDTNNYTVTSRRSPECGCWSPTIPSTHTRWPIASPCWRRVASCRPARWPRWPRTRGRATWPIWWA